jgi:molybdate transport system substrate-binding protein
VSLSEDGGEIKVLSATAMKAALTGLTPEIERATARKLSVAYTTPEIERATARKLSVAYTTSGGVAKRVAAGESADLIIIAATEMAGLVDQGKIVAASTAEIARSNIGVGVRRGTPKPDISSAAAFKHALVAARTVAYTDPAAGGASGTYLAGLLEKLGIADKIVAKLAAGGPGGLAGTIVVRGDAEIALHQIPELIAAGVELVGPLPPDLQQPTTYLAGIPAAARQAEAANVLLALLVTPAAAAAITAEGMAGGADLD